MNLNIVSPAHAVWKQVNTEKPRNEWDSPNPGTTMIAFEVAVPEKGNLTLVVVANSGKAMPGGTDRDGIVHLQLSDWD